jgi:NitT/TauT family transport system permease protein
MLFHQKKRYGDYDLVRLPLPNHWDVLGLLIVFTLIGLLAWAAGAVLSHYSEGQMATIDLSPIHLPYYALRSVFRMLIALCFSLLFTLIFGAWAAKSPRAERLIIPAIDILQSVPVLGFLTISVTVFLALFHGRVLGPECAAIFLIFTAQAWNMILSFYQSLKTLPKDLTEVSHMFQLSAWQRFWRVEVPFALPGLLWNMMLSMSASWVFLVATESISVAGHTIMLPGLGSYIGLAIAEKNSQAIGYVIIAMLLVIFIYDQLLFRPLVAWAEKFKIEDTQEEAVPSSWLLSLFQRARFIQFVRGLFRAGVEVFLSARWGAVSHKKRRYTVFSQQTTRYLDRLFHLLVIAVVGLGSWFLYTHFLKDISIQTVGHLFYLGLITALRVVIILAISSLIWVPIGVRIGLSPRATAMVQPMVQFLAAFPANLLFPFFVMLILRYHLNPNYWLSLLMILGTQWYVLFNVVAGASALPDNLKQVMNTLQVRGWLWWRRFILPGIFPYYITGAITAVGGAWNISILAESVRWGQTHLTATGLGAFIDQVSDAADFPLLVLGIVVMSTYVLLMNHFIWKPLYRFAERRFQIR